MAESSGKGKTPIARDWRYRALDKRNKTHPTENQVGLIECPFELRPESTPNVPNPYDKNVLFEVSDLTKLDPPPWTGYYALYRGARVAVVNYLGMWFEIRKREAIWEAYRLARHSLQLKDWPVEGANYALLYKTSEPIPESRATTPAPSHDSYHPPDQPQLVPIRTMFSSQTPRGLPPKKPRAKKNDHFFSDDEGDEERPKGKPVRLKGNAPTPFDGDRSKTEYFLAEFRRYMRLNNNSTMARDPMKKATYFLSLVKGENVHGWVLQQDEWLDKIMEGDETLPYHMNEWDVIQAEFKKAYTDYAAIERSNSELRALKMKDGDVDTYIAQFKMLANKGKHNLDEPELHRLFMMGMPQTLLATCLQLHNPHMFEEWTTAAQYQNQIYLRQKSLRADFALLKGGGGSNAFSSLGGWRARPQQSQRPTKQGNSNPRQLKPRDPNAMDTSATV
jgi:hypothetical protein